MGLFLCFCTFLHLSQSKLGLLPRNNVENNNEGFESKLLI